MTERTGGAYGLRLPTMSELLGQSRPQWLQEAPADWPTWTHSVRRGEQSDSTFVMTDEMACVPLPGARSLRLDRATRHVELRSDEMPPPASWVHPLLSPIAILVADWQRRLAFHSGAFLDRDGRAWALFGEREDGKSTALAWLADHAHEVLADDLVVTDGQVVFRGPRCVDLREEAAARYPVAEPVGSLGERDRWRYTLPAAPAEAPLAGFVQLQWSATSAVRVSDLSNTDVGREAVQSTRALLTSQQHPLAWLSLFSLPVLRFERPRSWSAIDTAMGTLLAELKHQ